MSSSSINKFQLKNGSNVAVIGGGPAGSFFTYSLLELASRLDLQLSVDIYEPRDFLTSGPKGCNMCAGIISESLIQILATEGINIPSVVVQRGIDSYTLHTIAGKTDIQTTVEESRIATVYRGAGPKDLPQGTDSCSFDNYLLQLAVSKGSNHIKEKITKIAFEGAFPVLSTANNSSKSYDLTVIATGVNSAFLKSLQIHGFKYKPPITTKSHVKEFFLGDKITEYLGNKVHIFLLNIPNLEFAAIVPKGNYATMCLIGKNIDNKLVENFLSSPQVKQCLPQDISLTQSCNCNPLIYLRASNLPYADRLVFIGDAAASRLYKDGIGAAYKTAKAAAVTAILRGVSADNFRRYYVPACKRIENDNKVGLIIFAINKFTQKRSYTLKALIRGVNREQRNPQSSKGLSDALWDTFTGSAPYINILKRMVSPDVLLRYILDLFIEITPKKNNSKVV